MTNPNLASQVVTDDKLEGLCKVLAQDRYQPSAVQVLYFLLQPAVEHNVQHWSQLGEAIRKSHHQNLQISTFGTVPDSSSLQAGDNQDRVEENVWGVASLYADEKFAEPRARFWISTETNARLSKNSGDQPKWQPDERSLAVLDTMFRTFFRPFLQTHGGTSIFFNGTNQCWTPHLGGLGRNLFDNLCSKAVRKFDLDAEIKVECPPGYRIRQLEEKDIETVISSNKIQFPASYARSRLFLSVAVVNGETDELASWVFAHADFSVGALHTAPAYRKRGLAPVVVAELGNKIRKALATNRLTSEVLKDSFWVHADSEADNVVAIRWFCSLGFKSCIANTWTRYWVSTGC